MLVRHTNKTGRELPPEIIHTLGPRSLNNDVGNVGLNLCSNMDREGVVLPEGFPSSVMSVLAPKLLVWKGHNPHFLLWFPWKNWRRSRRGWQWWITCYRRYPLVLFLNNSILKLSLQIKLREKKPSLIVVPLLEIISLIQSLMFTSTLTSVWLWSEHDRLPLSLRIHWLKLW